VGARSGFGPLLSRNCGIDGEVGCVETAAACRWGEAVKARP
jgi:hypothetical protein